MIHPISKISVIIPNYNYGHYLDQAIQSVLKQSYRDLELIVINNGSTDNSLEILNQYSGQIRIIDQPNLGQSGARNTGLSISQGEYIAFLDADDFWESNKLESQIMLLSDSVQLVYCGITPFKDDTNKKLQPVLPRYRGECSRYFVDIPGASVVLSGESTAIFSKALLKKVGLFDTELNSTAGWDFFRRCALHTNFDYVDEPLVNYRLHQSNMSNRHDLVIEDMRLSYSKLFNDKNWAFCKEKEYFIKKKLEWSFLKTYVRDFRLKMAIRSGIRLLKLISKSY